MSASEIPQHWALKLQLAAIAGNEPASSFLEVRPFDRTMEPARRSWAPVGELDRAVADVALLAGDLNVFVGVAPRTRQEGTAGAVERVWVLWADLDGPSALELLRDFRPLPSIVIRTGSQDHAHAYWPLRQPISGTWAQRANRRLALALGGDLNATDAARVLRPAGTLNHKHDPPGVVCCTRLELDVFSLDQVVGALPDDRSYVPTPRPPREFARGSAPGRLEALERKVRDAHEGTRNSVLFWAACCLSEDGELEDGWNALRTAGLDVGLSEVETDRTLNSALRSCGGVS